VDVICPECGQVVFHGSKKTDSADATLPKSIYACQCNYFSSSQLVSPLRVDEWAREVRRLSSDGATPSEPLLKAAGEVATQLLLALETEPTVSNVGTNKNKPHIPYNPEIPLPDTLTGNGSDGLSTGSARGAKEC
jgi:hypothetical protein